MWPRRSGQGWTRRISQACFRGVLPKNKLRFGRFRRVPQTQQVAGLGTNSLEYKGTYPNHPNHGKASGAKVREARIQMQCRWGTQGSHGRYVSFPHTLRGAVVTSRVTCYQPGNLFRGSTHRHFVGELLHWHPAYLCQAPKFKLHKGRQICYLFKHLETLVSSDMGLGSPPTHPNSQARSECNPCTSSSSFLLGDGGRGWGGEGLSM